MSTSSTSPLSGYFNGSSTYSQGLQQVITRAVQIASLPMQLLQQQQFQLTDEQTALQSLSQNAANIQSAISSLTNATGLSTFFASASDPAVATANVGSGVMAGTWSLHVVSMGSRSNAMSDALQAVTDPSKDNISASSAYTLTLNGQTFDLSLSDTSLNGLVNAINASGAGVQATVVNVGGATPDYRLSIQSQNYAADTIQLNDGTQDLLTQLSTGSPVTYQVNGQPAAPISSSSRTVTLAPGLTANLLAAGDADITVIRTGTSISNALNSFVNSYNATVDEAAKAHGTGADVLRGQSLVFNLEQSLRNIAGYAGSGNVRSISDLGLTFDDKGHLSLDQSVFQNATSQSMSDVVAFLGSSTTGFIGNATNTLKGLLDSTSGAFPTAQNNLASRVTALGTQISADQDRINQLQQTMTEQMAKADALISQLQQQSTYLTNLFSAMKINAQLQSGG